MQLEGSLLVTIVFNVPKNESLAALAPDGPGGADAWALYVSDWTAWNHVRTAASLAAAALLSTSFHKYGHVSIRPPFSGAGFRNPLFASLRAERSGRRE